MTGVSHEGFDGMVDIICKGARTSRTSTTAHGIVGNHGMSGPSHEGNEGVVEIHGISGTSDEGNEDGMDSIERASGETEKTFEHLIVENACAHHIRSLVGFLLNFRLLRWRLDLARALSLSLFLFPPLGAHLVYLPRHLGCQLARFPVLLSPTRGQCWLFGCASPQVSACEAGVPLLQPPGQALEAGPAQAHACAGDAHGVAWARGQFVADLVPPRWLMYVHLGPARLVVERLSSGSVHVIGMLPHPTRSVALGVHAVISCVSR